MSKRQPMSITTRGPLAAEYSLGGHIKYHLQESAQVFGEICDVDDFATIRLLRTRRIVLSDDEDVAKDRGCAREETFVDAKCDGIARDEDDVTVFKPELFVFLDARWRRI